MRHITAFMLNHFSTHQNDMRKLICKSSSYTPMHCVLQQKYVFGDITFYCNLRDKCFKKLIDYIQKMFIKYYVF